jgi:hypothetical protein
MSDEPKWWYYILFILGSIVIIGTVAVQIYMLVSLMLAVGG